MRDALQALPPMNPWLWSQTLGESFAAGFDPQGILNPGKVFEPERE